MHCGEAHWSSRCRSIARPPDGFSKENGGGGHGGDEEDDTANFTAPWCQRGAQNGSRDDGFQSTPRGRIPSNHAFPNKPSSAAV